MSEPIEHREMDENLYTGVLSPPEFEGLKAKGFERVPVLIVRDPEARMSDVRHLPGVIGMLTTPTGLDGRTDAEKVAEYERRIPQIEAMLRGFLPPERTDR